MPAPGNRALMVWEAEEKDGRDGDGHNNPDDKDDTH
jgi:hypothetical protein